jgi:sarcosine oxidase subunit gamma
MAEIAVEALPPGGMVTLKTLPGEAALAAALAGIGLAVPGRRRMLRAGEHAVLWMAPDEVLVLVPDAGAAIAAMAPALVGVHHLMADVSDARAAFRIAGPRAREVLAKLCPVDLHPAAFAAGDLRRTRAGQVVAALWAEAADDFRLLCFRSVAGYVAELLARSAEPAAAVGLFAPRP